MAYILIFGLALYAAVVTSMAPVLRRPVVMAFLVMLLIFTGMRGDSVDHFGYEAMFDLMLQLDMEYPERFFVARDVLFGVLMDGIQRLGGSMQALFLLSALISIALRQVAFARVLGDNTAVPWLATLCLSFFLHDFTQVRTAIAVPLCFLALQHLLAGRTRPWLGLSLLAIGFHLSALVFLPVTAVLLLPPRQRVVAWMIVTAIMALAILGLFETAGTLDNRIQVHGDTVGLNFTAIAIGAFKLVLLTVMAIKVQNLPSRLEALRQTAWPCVMFAATGLILLIVLRDLATVLAFRLYEFFFDGFAVWVVVAALLQPRPLTRLLAIGYCAFAVLLQYLPGLFVDYKLAPLTSLLG
jgi:hypothetical protein